MAGYFAKRKKEGKYYTDRKLYYFVKSTKLSVYSKPRHAHDLPTLGQLRNSFFLEK